MLHLRPTANSTIKENYQSTISPYMTRDEKALATYGTRPREMSAPRKSVRVY